MRDERNRATAELTSQWNSAYSSIGDIGCNNPANLHGEHVHTSLDAGSPDPKCDDLKPVNSNGETEFVTQEKTISAFKNPLFEKVDT